MLDYSKDTDGIYNNFSDTIEVYYTSIENKNSPQNGLFWFVQHSLAQQSELGERVPKGSYQILGITGATILVIPEYNVVVAKMYNKRYNYGGDNYLYYLREFSNLVADTFANGE